MAPDGWPGSWDRISTMASPDSWGMGAPLGEVACLRSCSRLVARLGLAPVIWSSPTDSPFPQGLPAAMKPHG